MQTEQLERHFRRRYPPAPSAVADARRAVRRWLAGATTAEPDDDLVECVELLVSELMTNAVVHAGTQVEVSAVVTAAGDGVRVEISDGSPRLPTMRAYGAQAGTGRGLRLLERLAVRWGAERTEGGKCVWFAVGPGSEELVGEEQEPPPEEPDAATATVRLNNMPLMLYRAWVQHAESLLREYLLATMEADSPEAAITQHSEASDAIAVLEEWIPAFDIGNDPELALAATEPAVTADLVTLAVPREAGPHFATLDDALTSALAMARDQLLLTPPIQPELVALRVWICSEVDRQLRGAAATPWHPELSESSDGEAFPVGELRDVRESADPVLAADSYGTIVAVSPAAAEFLGYGTPAELEGTRLVAIIPTRYRQAHLAGFTLHHLNGRAPLLGTTVVVPALRRDGQEVEVRLTVQVRLRQEREQLFVAALS